MTLCTLPAVGVRAPIRERRPGRPPSGKRLAMMQDMPAKVRSAMRRSLDPCDNSNDSGLGFEHHGEPHHFPDRVTWNGERAEPKRPKMDIKLENGDEEGNDGFCFPETLRTCEDSTSLIRTAPAGSIPSLSMNSNQPTSSGRAVPRCVPLSNRQSSSAPVALTTQITATSRYAEISLTIIKQPEQQHRARYQTEGSRGAVKDRGGGGFPVVQLTGYYKPATLQVFIGTDIGKVAPHMFYQACKVSGKNSTPCIEKKIEGTCVIELQLDPSKEMCATCDCVGILKERNVDVEHRFPEQLGNRSKKKSTRCRMIFRTSITHEDGSTETLQVCSQPIVCTQPPGIPEICKKSLISCPASGGLELFVLGKNFLKDTKVFFQRVDDDGNVRWEQSVAPDKEYLQQTHFVCVVPPYCRPDVTEPVTVRLCVVSSQKTSEPHQFVYTPVNGAIPSVHVDPSSPVVQSPPQPIPPQNSTSFFNKILWEGSSAKREQDLGMMPPPESNMVPLATRRPSISLPSTSDNLSSLSPPLRSLKQEYIDDNSQNSNMDPLENSSRTERYRHISESSLDVHHGDSNISMINENSIDMLNHNSLMSHQSDNSNLSMHDESSNDFMTRRNSLSRRSAHTINEDNACSNVLHGSSAVVTDRLVLSQPAIIQQNLLATAQPELSDLKVMDLRMKMPIADLASTSAPAIATLHSLGVSADAPLPPQSGQSVENFLTNMESKSIPEQTNKLGLLMPSSTEPVFLSSHRNFMNTVSQAESLHMVAKSEAAAIAEQAMTPQTQNSIVSTMAQTLSTVSVSVDTSMAAPINAEKIMDQLVNSTVESHIIGGSQQNAPAVITQTEPKNIVTASQQPDVIRDVMLSSRLIPPVINNSPTMLDIAHTSPNLPSDVILNSQISPSLMCRNPQDTLLPAQLPPICQASTVVEQNSPPPTGLVTSALSIVSNMEQEKVVLIRAAVDLFETQKKISEMEQRNQRMVDEIITMSNGEDVMPPVAAPNQFVQSPILGPQPDILGAKSLEPKSTASFVLPTPVKEMNGGAEKNKTNDDRMMIPQSFTSLSESELISLINPSCFDQGNNNNFQ